MAEPVTETSVQFNLAELMRLEQERLDAEQRRATEEREQAIQACRTARAEAERAERARRTALLEAEAARTHGAQRDAERLAQEREARLLAVRLEHERAAAAEERERARQHDLALRQLQLASGRRDRRAWLWGGLGCTALLATGLLFANGVQERLTGATRALAQARIRLESERGGLDAMRAELSALRARGLRAEPLPLPLALAEARVERPAPTSGATLRPARQVPRPAARPGAARGRLHAGPAAARPVDPLSDLASDNDDPLEGLMGARPR